MIIRLLLILYLLTSPVMALATGHTQKSLIVGSEQDFPPFAIGRTDETAAGFSVDLWKEVARETGLKYSLRVRPWAQVLQEFKDGKIDVLINIAQSDERHQYTDFSVPHAIVNGAIFVRKGEKRIRSEEDLTDKSILVFKSDLAHEYALSKGWQKQLVLVDTSRDGLRLLSSGKYDAMLLGKLAGMQTLKDLDIKNIIPLEKPAGYSQKFSFGAHKGDSKLLATINEGLAITKADGNYDAIYQKWFGVYEVKKPTLRDMLPYLTAILILFLLAYGYLLRKRLIERRQSEKALRESEERFKNMFRSHSAVMLLIEPESGALVDANLAAEDFYGYTRETLLKMKISDLNTLSPETIAIERQKVLADEKRVLIFPHRIASGEIRTVESHSTPIQQDNNTLLFSIVHDITERKRSESYRNMGQEILLALNDSGNQQQAIQRIVDIVKSVTAMDAVGIRLQDGEDFPYFCQDGFSQDFLKTENSLLSRAQDGGICRNEEGNICLECTCGLVVSGKTDMSSPLFTKNGSAWTNDSFPFLHVPADEDARTNPRNECIHQGYASIALVPIRAKGRIVGLFQLNDRRKGRFTLEGIEELEEIAENIGEAMLRKQAEEKLIASERFLRMLTDQLPGMVAYWSDELRCSFANHAYQEWFGRTPEEMLGITIQEMMGEELFSRNEPYIRKTLQGEAQHFERALVKPGGEIGYTWAHYVPDTVEGRTRGFFVMVSDITELKRAEAEKDKLETQLLQAQKMELVGRLAGGVAHDFNNMLGVILGHAELALMTIDDTDPLHEDMIEIRNAADRSANLTRQLLAFARKQTIAPQTLNLNDTVSAMLKMLQRLIGEDIHLTWQPAPELWVIKADPSQIDQILANLCVNSRDAIKSTGMITIATENSTIDTIYCNENPDTLPGEYVRLIVCDDGSGMDKDTISHIFEPFYTTKDLGVGTGLGLATVFGIVKQNNGFINVYSEPGHGTTFSIYLPRIESNKMPNQADNVAASIPKGHETILLVEDEPAILKMTTIMLSKQGYTVLKAGNPGDAIRLALEHAGDINLLMTDVIMPGMNGRELSKKLLKTHPDMKHLFMSGYTADVIANQGVLADDVHFIQKPFSLPALAAKVRAVLAQ